MLNRVLSKSFSRNQSATSTTSMLHKRTVTETHLCLENTRGRQVDDMRHSCMTRQSDAPRTFAIKRPHASFEHSAYRRNRRTNTWGPRFSLGHRRAPLGLVHSGPQSNTKAEREWSYEHELSTVYITRTWIP